MKKWIVAFIAIIAAFAIRYSDPWFLEAVRMKALDVHQQNLETVMLDDIVTIEINNETIRQYGQWAWPRGLIAEQLVRIFSAGAGLVVMPMLFSEEDRFGEDDILVDILKQAPVIVGQIPSNESQGNPVPRGVAMIGLDWTQWLYAYDTAIGPIASIGEHAAGVGMLNVSPESDGVVRRLPLAIQIDGNLYPSISLETLRVAAGDISYQIKTTEAGVEAFRIPKYSIIQTDQSGSIWIDFRYKTNVYPLHEELPDLTGKIVIVSLTASGLDYPVATPIGVIGGHDVIATSLTTMMTGTNITAPYWVTFAELAFIVLGGVIVAGVVLVLPWFFSLITAAIVVGTYFGSAYLFNHYGYLIDWSYPALSIFFIWSISAFMRFMEEFKKRQEIKKQFEHYLAPAMVKKLQKNPGLLQLGGDTRELTLLFCDIRGFTPISEQYKTNPQGLTQLINRFLTPMTTIIMENDGTIDKYMGDCIMAFWNAPLDVENQRRKSILSSHLMMEKLNELNKELEKENLLPINIGIGLNTGDVVVGNMGSNQRFDYSCLGDAVNLAARLEGQSKGYGVKIVIGEETARDMHKDFLVVELDKIAVKGKTEGVTIYTSLGLLNKKSYEMELKQHQNFLDFYRNQDWEMAEQWANTMKTEFDEELKLYYEIMISRIQELKLQELPEDWDGVFVATTK